MPRDHEVSRKPSSGESHAPDLGSSWLRRLLLAATAFLVGAGLVLELRTSFLQAHLFAHVGRRVASPVFAGAGDGRLAPPGGPYDRRLGYDRIPAWVERLRSSGFRVEAQARPSAWHRRLRGLGLFPIDDEKDRSGLDLKGAQGESLYASLHPERHYPHFDSIPDLVVQTLLFVENRELLSPERPYRNPAVEWDRLVHSTAQWLRREIGGEGPVSGASTLATQIEKFRHSPEGLTRSPTDKLRQMASASARAYLRGPETSRHARELVRSYLNSVPLAAVPGHGEVIGLPEGLEAWYGLEHREVGTLLAEVGRETEDKEASPSPSPDRLESAARAYRAVVGLVVAQRRPTYYLLREAGRSDLEELINAYLGLLHRAGVISPTLFAAAREVRLEPRPNPKVEEEATSPISKGARGVRHGLLSLLDISSLYDLDRLDLTAETTIDGEAQARVEEELHRLADPEHARESGLTGPRLLNGEDPSRVLYSVVLMEQTPFGPAVRVQADNYPGPFDLNDAGRLELGSTAKLRVLVTYLEIIEELYRKLGGAGGIGQSGTRSEDGPLPSGPADPLTDWVEGYLLRQPDASLEAVLEAALGRRYSAHTGERFFTGSGIHTFSNFDAADNGRILTVREGLRRSVNLVFIRLLRDVVRYETARLPHASPGVPDEPDHPGRRALLERFAHEEGRRLIDRFYGKYRGRSPEGILAGIGEAADPGTRARAWAFRAVAPEAPPESLASYLASHPPRRGEEAWTKAEGLYRRTDPGPHDLSDLGYLSGVRPLELWVARRLFDKPDLSLEDLRAESVPVRLEAFAWLFRTGSVEAQNRRIRIVLERDAFERIQKRWRALGFPFRDLVPSLATGIGSSGDRPAALAELVGIIQSGGVRRSPHRVRALHFAEGTPYETRLVRDPVPETRVLSKPVAATVRRALVDVVERGTARRAAGALDGAIEGSLQVGGKTGTGDNRIKVVGPGGRASDGEAMNRTATFVFFVGDRFFGTITASVLGPDADRYRFTSSLPTQLFRHLSPAIAELVRRPSEVLPDPLRPLPGEGRGVRLASLPPEPGASPGVDRDIGSSSHRLRCPEEASGTAPPEEASSLPPLLRAEGPCAPDLPEGSERRAGERPPPALPRLRTVRTLFARTRLAGTSSGIRDPP